MATILPGVLPNILLASFPTARTSPEFLSTATTEGSLKTIPFPLTYAITVAVPRSIPISCPKPNIIISLSVYYKCVTIILHTRKNINLILK